ncbi:MAG: FeoB small GTPase domain-containing protein [Eubacterium sp.]
MKRNKRVVLIGNPNAGKSTVFKEITGVHYPGSTTDINKGEYYYKFANYELVNLPSTYSLLSYDQENSPARDYLCFEDYDCVVCVIDATDLLHNLDLVLQLIEITDKAVLLLNFTDKVKKKNIEIDTYSLTKILGIPVVKATAKSGKGINELLEQIYLVSNEIVINEPKRTFYSNDIENAIYQVIKGLKGNIETDKSLRFFALKLLENDDSFNSSIKAHFGGDIFHNGSLRGNLNNAKRELRQLGYNKEKLVNAIVASIFERAKSIFELTVNSLPKKKQPGKAVFIKLFKYISMLALLLFILVFFILKAYNYV